MRILVYAGVLFLGVFASPAYACPGANGIPDYNCDGKVVVSITGDSIVYGIGDTANGNRGGYVLRTQKKLPGVTIHNLGVSGLGSRELLLLIRSAFEEGKEDDFRNAALESDVFIIDLGRNDRWLFGPPIETYRNLKRAGKQIKQHVANLQNGLAPLVVTAVMLLPNRGSQGPWVKDLNAIILRGDTTENPADLRFDLVSKRLLSSDQIHPTPVGYTALANTLVSYLKKKVPRKMDTLRPDSDGDTISDIVETKIFGTDPKDPDTDHDQHPDGNEIFSRGSNPTLAD